MGHHATWTLLACVVLFCKEASPAIWSAPVQVKGFNSYLDVLPIKYFVPSGLSQMTLTFQTGRNNRKCAAKEITILIQYGGLPHVIETNQTFPNNFKVDEPALAVSMSKEQRISFSVVWPPPGPWFIIAYSPREDKAIKQKGLGGDDDCIYFYKSTMEPDYIVRSTVIDYKETQEFTVGFLGTLFRFKVPTSTMSFNFNVTKCDPSPCNIVLTHIPYERASPNIELCNDSSKDCVLHVESPPLGDYQFLEIRYNGYNITQRITFIISVTECTSEPRAKCLSLPKLDRMETSGPFNCVFGFMTEANLSLFVDLRKAPYIVVPFEIIDQTDVGGTLGWRLRILNSALVNNKVIVQICGTLLYNYLPDVTGHFDLCSSGSRGITQNFSLPSTVNPSFYVPYPKVGLWHIMLQVTCFDGTGNLQIPCPLGVFASMELRLSPCLDGDCSDKGTCAIGSLSPDLVLFTACRCDARYQGYACTDDTNAQSEAVQIAGACLLTLSNLFFVPAIIIAVRRRYLVEAFIYFYNMFFSTFYHACDGMRLEKYRMCIMKYDVLQASDFFASASSLWVTLVAMARIRYPYVTPLLQIMGPFGLLIGVVYDKTSLYVIAVPIAFGLAVIVASWGHRMYKRKKLYPSWRRYVLFLLPGLVLAAVGASVFSFLETEDNYKYVHSVWHTCIALSICLFLPPRRLDEYSIKSSESVTCHLADSVTQEHTEGTVEEINVGFETDST